MDFDQAFELTVGHEGGFTANPKDRGNWTGGRIGVGELKGTKFGISAAAYPHLDIRNLTLDQAKAIYLTDYWGVAGCPQLPSALKFDVFDFAVNSGPGTAARRLQRVVGAVEDGAVGPKTLACIGNFHPLEVRLKLLGERMTIMANDPSWDTHGAGWMRRLATNTKVNA